MTATAALTLADLTTCGAHQRGHFLLSSGLHSGDYLQCALYLAQPRRAAKAGELLAELVRAAGLAPDLVVAPAMGGLIIGHETARALDLPFLFSEREGGAMTLRRGFALAPRQRVLVVEDVVTTGKSTLEAAAAELASGPGSAFTYCADTAEEAEVEAAMAEAETAMGGIAGAVAAAFSAAAGLI